MAIRADEVDLGRDRDLVERYQAGDPSAFDDLYDRYFDRLRAYCHRRVHDPHEAEELAQEAFIRALRALPRFAGERRFYPWMTVIAQRLCVDHHRRRSRLTVVPDVDTGSTDDDGSERVLLDVDLANLAAAMERLAPRHRQVLALREQQGWSYQQIAEHLDVPMTTVEALLHRARKALRREFQAVAGDGRLAAIPLVAWLARAASSLRDRMPEVSTLATPVAAGAMTVALAVAPVGGSSGGTGPGVGPTATTAARSPVVAAAVDEPVEAAARSGIAVAATPATAPPPTAAGTPAPPAPAPVAAPPVSAGPAEVFAGPGGEAAAGEASDDMSTRADAGPAWVAADPGEITQHLPLPPLGGDQ